MTPRQSGPILILLDMNGTLLLRLKGKLAGLRPDLTHAGLNYYFRAGVCDLVSMLLDHPRVVLAFYTSMRESNALPAVLQISGGRKRVEIYDRDFNKKDEWDGAKDWDTVRDMHKIWTTKGRAGYGFNARNTVMVDDSSRKMRQFPGNLVLIPEFKRQEHYKDGTMDRLSTYLSSLLSQTGDDVRPLLASEKFG